MPRITHEPTRQLVRKHRDEIDRASGEAQTIHAAQLILDLANIETEDINTYHALAPVIDVTQDALADIQDAIDRAIARLDKLTAQDPTPAPVHAPPLAWSQPVQDLDAADTMLARDHQPDDANTVRHADGSTHPTTRQEQIACGICRPTVCTCENHT